MLVGPRKVLIDPEESADNAERSMKMDYFLEFHVHFCYDIWFKGVVFTE